MKRILFFIVMTLCAMTTFAQETKEQIQKSEERAKNLRYYRKAKIGRLDRATDNGYR